MNLLWTKTKQRRVADLRVINTGTGCSCFFLRTSPKTGIKIYCNARDRDFAYKNQIRAEKAGIAPLVGEKFKITGNGMISRVVQIIGREVMRYDWKSHKPPFYGYVTEAIEIPKNGISEQQLQDLKSKMSQLNLSTFDINSRHNVGLKNGVAVCYDFDRVSML